MPYSFDSQSVSERTGVPVEVIHLDELNGTPQEMQAQIDRRLAGKPQFQGIDTSGIVSNPGPQMMPRLESQRFDGDGKSIWSTQKPESLTLFGDQAVSAAVLIGPDRNAQVPEIISEIARVPPDIVNVQHSPELAGQMHDIDRAHEEWHIHQQRTANVGVHDNFRVGALMEWDAERGGIRTLADDPRYSNAIDLRKDARNVGNFLFDNRDYSIGGLLNQEIPQDKYGTDIRAARDLIFDNDAKFNELYTRAHARANGQPITENSATLQQTIQNVEVSGTDSEHPELAKQVKAAMDDRATYSTSIRQDPKAADAGYVKDIMHNLEIEMREGAIDNPEVRKTGDAILKAEKNIMPELRNTPVASAKADTQMIQQPQQQQQFQATPSEEARAAQASQQRGSTANSPVATTPEVPPVQPTSAAHESTAPHTEHGSAPKVASTPKISLKGAVASSAPGLLIGGAVGGVIGAGTAIYNGQSTSEVLKEAGKGVAEGIIPGSTDAVQGNAAGAATSVGMAVATGVPSAIAGGAASAAVTSVGGGALLAGGAALGAGLAVGVGLGYGTAKLYEVANKMKADDQAQVAENLKANPNYGPVLNAALVSSDNPKLSTSVSAGAFKETMRGRDQTLSKEMAMEFADDLAKKLQDPGNLGKATRTAYATHLKEHGVDVNDPNAVKQYAEQLQKAAREPAPPTAPAPTPTADKPAEPLVAQNSDPMPKARANSKPSPRSMDMALNGPAPTPSADSTNKDLDSTAKDSPSSHPMHYADGGRAVRNIPSLGMG